MLSAERSRFQQNGLRRCAEPSRPSAVGGLPDASGRTVDILTKAERSARMALIRSTGTRPEQIICAALREAGYRFELHDRLLPGTPDFVFRRRRKVIFVHGCFWHLHSCQSARRKPKTRKSYWLPKLEANRKRDARNRRRLVAAGWRVLTVWECQIDNPSTTERVRRFLVKP